MTMVEEEQQHRIPSKQINYFSLHSPADIVYSFFCALKRAREKECMISYSDNQIEQTSHLHLNLSTNRRKITV